MTLEGVEHRTLAVVYICVSLSISIMVLRLVLGRICNKKRDLGDQLTGFAILFAIARVAFVHIIVIWKTNNIDPDLVTLENISDREIYTREIGAKVTLVARNLYVLLLWIQKSVLLTFYGTLLKDLPAGQRAVKAVWVVLGVTFIASIVSTYTECHPFSLYWKILPTTPRCTRAIVQLFVVGATNIFTDVILFLLPIPVLVNVRLTWQKKLQLTFLFSVGLVIIAVTAVRLPKTYFNAGSETNRITWTTGEFLAATFVANAPVLYSFRKRWQVRNGQGIRRFSVGRRRPRPELGGTTLTGFETRSDEIVAMDVEEPPVEMSKVSERSRVSEVDEISERREARKEVQDRKPSLQSINWGSKDG